MSTTNLNWWTPDFWTINSSFRLPGFDPFVFSPRACIATFGPAMKYQTAFQPGNLQHFFLDNFFAKKKSNHGSWNYLSRENDFFITCPIYLIGTFFGEIIIIDSKVGWSQIWQIWKKSAPSQVPNHFFWEGSTPKNWGYNFHPSFCIIKSWEKKSPKHKTP